MIAVEGRPALIHHLRRDRTYVAAEAALTGPAVTFVGQLKHTDATGERLYPSSTRTLPLADVEIEWGEAA